MTKLKLVTVVGLSVCSTRVDLVFIHAVENNVVIVASPFCSLPLSVVGRDLLDRVLLDIFGKSKFNAVLNQAFPTWQDMKFAEGLLYLMLAFFLPEIFL